MAAKSAKIIRPNGSHWLAQQQGKFDKEELYPVLEIDLPRVGTVSAKFSVDRYVASSWDEQTGTSSPVWTDWRIVLRDVEPSHGVGDSTRSMIREAGEPLIQEWLASDDYAASRKRAAYHMVKRAITDGRPTATYNVDRNREVLATFRDELAPEDAERLSQALDHLAQASALLDA